MLRGQAISEVEMYWYKAMQTTLLVSHQHTDGNGCGREVIIHYSLYPVKNLFMEKRLYYIMNTVSQ